MVIQVNLVFRDLKVNFLIKDGKYFFLWLISLIIGERGLPGLRGLPGNSSVSGGLPGPQGRMYLWMN
jgi:hypothetical protein